MTVRKHYNYNSKHLEVDGVGFTKLGLSQKQEGCIVCHKGCKFWRISKSPKFCVLQNRLANFIERI